VKPTRVDAIEPKVIPVPVKDIAYCSMDTITIISKMLHNLNDYGWQVAPGAIK